MSFFDYSKELVNDDLVKILDAIKKSSIAIEQKVNRAALDDIQGNTTSSSENSSGDIQKKLDVISNDIMIDLLTKTKCCSILLSEENEDAIIIEPDFRGQYMIAFDPLDGSTNIDCNCCIGTIFSIYEDFNQEIGIQERVLKSGNDVICAGYILYGPATELVITIDRKKEKKSVQKFTLDRISNEYLYTGEIDISNKMKKIYSVNESNCASWYQDIKEYVDQYKIENTKYTQRYIGSMVADVHRTLLYGGMFGYPADKKNKNGKLRVIYECFPISKIMEAAGGASIIGNFSKKRILDIVPSQIHEKTSIIMGSTEEIDKYVNILDIQGCKTPIKCDGHLSYDANTLL